MSEEGSSCSKRSKVGDESFLPVTVDLAAVLQEQEEEEEREDLLSVASFASRSLSSFVTTRPLVSLPAPGELLRRPDKTVNKRKKKILSLFCFSLIPAPRANGWLRILALEI